MKHRFWQIAAAVLSVFLSSSIALAQNPVRINWTAVTGAQSGMFMAQQEKLFKKYGLDVELLHIPSSSRGIQAILAGDEASGRQIQRVGRERRQRDQRRPPATNLFGERGRPAAGSEGHDFQTIRLGRDDVQRLEADGSGAAEEGDALCQPVTRPV